VIKENARILMDAERQQILELNAQVAAENAAREARPQ
jgi:hypothetical protein